MKLYSIETGVIKLDGGAMFGVVPRSIWGKRYEYDENNLIELSMRCLLIIEDDRKILIDTGMGDKQGEKYFKHFHPRLDNNLIESLKQCGVSPSDITDLVLTHLHFDHCGGAAVLDNNGEPEMLFKNAKVWVAKDQWNSALKPNHRERPSMRKENYLPLQDGKELCQIVTDVAVTKNVQLRLTNGHTAGMIVPVINYDGKTIVYGADIFPTSAHVHVPFVTAYDIQPLKSLDEKSQLLDYIVENDGFLIYEHDVNIECTKIEKTEKGFRKSENSYLISEL